MAAVSVLGNVVVVSVVIAGLSVRMSRSGRVAVSVPPGRTVTMDGLVHLPVNIMGGRLLVVSALIAHEQVFIFVYFVTL